MSEPAGPDALRVGTAEREEAVRVLGDHFAAGRLPVEEYEQRVTGALEAQTRGELRLLFYDLPGPYPHFMIVPQATPVMAVPVVPMIPVSYVANRPVVSPKSKVVAGVLQIVLPFGIGRFYTGHTGIAVAQLITAFFFFGIVWSFIDGIVLLIKGGTDGDGLRLKDS